jgi:ubiquinone/menaquinone biosynthesis C-methylase UbiE
LADVARANALFGGTRAVMAEIDAVLDRTTARTITLLDIGTGIGDIPARVREVAARRGITIITYGVEHRESIAHAAHSRVLPMVCADARALPFACRSVDIVMCSQVLHHFEQADGIALLREMNRVARHRVVVSDLRRSWLAAAGIWVASFPLRFHPFSRHDGVVSVLRGFTRGELRELVHTAVRHTPSVHDRLGFRTTAAWSPMDAST